MFVFFILDFNLKNYETQKKMDPLYGAKVQFIYQDYKHTW